MCADVAKNDYLTLLNHCVEGCGGNVPIFQKLWRIRSQANHFSWNNNVVNFSYFATKNWIEKNQSAKVHLSEE